MRVPPPAARLADIDPRPPGILAIEERRHRAGVVFSRRGRKGDRGECLEWIGYGAIADQRYLMDPKFRGSRTDRKVLSQDTASFSNCAERRYEDHEYRTQWMVPFTGSESSSGCRIYG